MIPPYPIRLSDDRTLPAGYDGNVFIWDIDKTYLATRFSSFKGLARIPIEFAIDKRCIDGMNEVLRGLRRGPGEEFASTPIYFISSSPPQLQRVIERKMLLDGVQPDGFIFKDWAGALRQLRPGRLKEHLGFKLAALLMGRASRPAARELLFGDDVERDADAYALYADILSGSLASGDLDGVLADNGVAEDDRECLVVLVENLGTVPGSVERIYIHLVRSNDPRPLASRSPELVPIRGAFQLALSLYEGGYVDRATVSRVIEDLRRSSSSIYSQLSERAADAIDRGLITREILDELELNLPMG